MQMVLSLSFSLSWFPSSFSLSPFFAIRQLGCRAVTLGAEMRGRQGGTTCTREHTHQLLDKSVCVCVRVYDGSRNLYPLRVGRRRRGSKTFLFFPPILVCESRSFPDAMNRSFLNLKMPRSVVRLKKSTTAAVLCVGIYVTLACYPQCGTRKLFSPQKRGEKCFHFFVVSSHTRLAE